MGQWKTTRVLFLIAVGLGGLLFWQSNAQETADVPTPTAVALPPLLGDVALAQVRRVEVRDLEQERMVVFEREGETWTPADEARVGRLENGLNFIWQGATTQLLPPDQNPLVAYGLEIPRYQIALTVEDSAGSAVYDLFIGNPTPTRDSFYIRKAGDERIYILPQTGFRSLLELLDEE